MITNDGRRHIRQILTLAPIARAISFGVGSRAESVTDTALQFEVYRSDITLVAYDFLNNRIVYKASLPASAAGNFREVALWSLATDNVSGAGGSRMLASFDSFEAWTNGTYATTNTRVGADSLRIAPAASSTTTSTGSVRLDMSLNSAVDIIKLAYNVNNAYVANVKIRFMSDTSNYYEFTITSPPTGYNITELLKGNAVVVGSPSWATITSLQVSVTSTAAGVGTVDFDAVRVDDADNLNPEYVLVSRETLIDPVVKEVGRTQEIEYSLGVSVG